MVYTGANSPSTFRFFTNGTETETEGFDVVATYSLDSSVGITGFSIAYNQNETDVTKAVPAIIDDTRVKELEEGLPETRYNIAAVHTMNDWHFMARYSYFDDWYDSEDTLSYDGYGVVDAAAGVGNQYSQWAPGGFNGQFVYMRLIYDF